MAEAWLGLLPDYVSKPLSVARIITLTHSGLGKIRS